MSLKRLRTKLEIADAVVENPFGMVFKNNGKYYTDLSYSREVPESHVIENNITVIQFKKQNISIND